MPYVFDTSERTTALGNAAETKALLHLLSFDEVCDKVNVRFLGPLDVPAMRDRYLRTHVYVSPSTIENSSNSVGVAMLLGCPVVSSNVGRVSDLLYHGKEGFLYQSSAPYMLAWYVKRLFDDDSLAMEFSHASRERSSKTHDRDANLSRLLCIYESISSSGGFSRE